MITSLYNPLRASPYIAHFLKQCQNEGYIGPGKDHIEKSHTYGCFVRIYSPYELLCKEQHQ